MLHPQASYGSVCTDRGDVLALETLDPRKEVEVLNAGESVPQNVKLHTQAHHRFRDNGLIVLITDKLIASLAQRSLSTGLQCTSLEEL